jgi:hypothetical protein
VTYATGVGRGDFCIVHLSPEGVMVLMTMLTMDHAFPCCVPLLWSPFVLIQGAAGSSWVSQSRKKSSLPSF